MNKLLHEPLFHFFALGALLFLLYGLVSGPGDYEPDEIVVDEARIAALSANFQKTWQRPPTATELEGLVNAWIREEVLYREGLAAGFDANDPVIRRRVAQKMNFVADGMVPDAPTDAELNAWLADNIDDYRIPATYTLQQVYIDPQRHSDDLEAFVATTLERLQGGAEAKSQGDSTLLLSAVENASSVDIGRIFGSEFVAGLAAVAPGSWQGPVRSGYGLHFVKIDALEPARDPALTEVRPAVERDLLNEKASELNEVFYQSLLQRYTVRYETETSDD